MLRSHRTNPGRRPLRNTLRAFFATEVAGAVLLLVAATAALVWANSGWGHTYDQLWATQVRIPLGPWDLALDLRHWVNEALMALFFLVVALEIRRELVEGELRDPRRAALPVVAAVGGMCVPALIYLALNAGGSGQRGWGIPMATDIAFALGLTALVGRGLPSSLRLFLLTLAIVDDIGAILVIALFYSHGVAWSWLVVAAAIVALLAALRRSGVVFLPVFLCAGFGVWFALYESGVHATLAGVATGLLLPRRSTLEAGLHPWTSLLVVPVFALANAGVSLSASSLDDAVGSRVTWGVVAGLVVGKTVGIGTFAWLACRVRLASLPEGATWRQLLGVSALAGIGFTVSLFVSGLAFDRAQLVDEAKLGIVGASLLASAFGAAILFGDRRRTRRAAVSEAALAGEGGVRGGS